MKDTDQQSLSPANGGRLGALARLAQRVLIVERAWPPLVFALAVVILFLAASWLGAWQFAPRSLRVAGVVLFAIACGIALAPLARMRRPAARDVLARLDRDAGASHRPASSLADSLANDHGDPGTQAMWAAHRARLERAVEAIRVAPPSPRMAERDPYAIRFGVALLAFAAAVVAGPETYGRLAAAFDWRSDAAIAAAATSRIDAWIDPPPYAGRPPVVIDFKTAAPQTLNIPEDSILVVRGDPSLIETRIEGAISPSDQKGDAAEKTRTEKRWTIHGAGKATILRSGAPVAVAVLAVTPAGAPTIASTEEPRANISGSLTLAYHVDDRFGLAGARADFARPHEGTGPPPRTLAPPPQAALQLPPTANGVGDAKTTVDLSEHPWAGAKVTMRLSAVSISGKTGQSGPIEMTLPQRIVPQSAGPGAGRAAPRPHSRSRQCAKARRDGADGSRDRAGIVRHAGQDLSRPEAGQRARCTTPRATPISSTSPRCYGRWPKRSRTATRPRPSATSGPPSRRSAKRSSAARAIRKSASSWTRCARPRSAS